MSIPIPLFRCRFSFSPRHATNPADIAQRPETAETRRYHRLRKTGRGKKKKEKEREDSKEKCSNLPHMSLEKHKSCEPQLKGKKMEQEKKKQTEKKSGNTPKRILHANPSTDAHIPIRQDVNNSNKKKKTGWRPFASCSIYRTFQAPSLTARRGTWRWLPYLRIVLTTRYYFCFLFLRFTKNEKVCGPDL